MTNYTLSKLQPRGPRARRIAAIKNVSPTAFGAPYDPSTAHNNTQAWRDFAYTDSVSGSVFPSDFDRMFGANTRCHIQNLPNNGVITTTIDDWQTVSIAPMTLKDGSIGNAITQTNVITNSAPPPVINPPQQPFSVISRNGGGWPRVPRLYLKFDMIIPGNIRTLLNSSTNTSTDDYYWTCIDIKTNSYNNDESDGDFKWSLGMQNNGGLHWVSRWINLGHDPNHSTNFAYYTVTQANDYGLPTSGVDEWVTLEIEITAPKSQSDLVSGRTWIAITDKNGVRTMLCDRRGGIACGYLGLPIGRLLTPVTYGRPAGLTTTWANWELWDGCPYPQL